MPRGYVKMLMEDQAARQRPGMPQHTNLTWKRCGALRWLGDEPCGFNGEPILICGRCWDDRKVFSELTILGPLTAPIGIICASDEGCGGRDLEVQGYSEPTEDPKVPGRIYYSPETHQLEVWQ
jgi:hypothetical protein